MAAMPLGGGSLDVFVHKRFGNVIMEGLQMFWRRCRYKYHGGDAATNIMAAMPLGGEHLVFGFPNDQLLKKAG